MKPEVGRTYYFKYDFYIRHYGATATVTRISWSIDRPHPGHLTHKWIDLTTANGTAIQWPPATFKRNLREEESQ